MADVSIHDGALHVEFTVPERVLSLHGRSVTVPTESIARMHPVSDVLAEVRGLKMPGAGIPGVLAIGTWRGEDQGRSFHDLVVIHRPGSGVVIELRDADYDRVVIGSEDPAAFLAELRA